MACSRAPCESNDVLRPKAATRLQATWRGRAERRGGVALFGGKLLAAAKRAGHHTVMGEDDFVVGIFDGYCGWPCTHRRLVAKHGADLVACLREMFEETIFYKESLQTYVDEEEIDGLEPKRVEKLARRRTYAYDDDSVPDGSGSDSDGSVDYSSGDEYAAAEAEAARRRRDAKRELEALAKRAPYRPQRDLRRIAEEADAPLPPTPAAATGSTKKEKKNKKKEKKNKLIKPPDTNQLTPSQRMVVNASRILLFSASLKPAPENNLLFGRQRAIIRCLAGLRERDLETLYQAMLPLPDDFYLENGDRFTDELGGYLTQCDREGGMLLTKGFEGTLFEDFFYNLNLLLGYNAAERPNDQGRSTEWSPEARELLRQLQADASRGLPPGVLDDCVDPDDLPDNLPVGADPLGADAEQELLTQLEEELARLLPPQAAPPPPLAPQQDTTSYDLHSLSTRNKADVYPSGSGTAVHRGCNPGSEERETSSADQRAEQHGPIAPPRPGAGEAAP